MAIDNEIAIIVRVGLLALIKPCIREGESNGMEHDERGIGEGKREWEGAGLALGGEARQS